MGFTYRQKMYVQIFQQILISGSVHVQNVN